MSVGGSQVGGASAVDGDANGTGGVGGSASGGIGAALAGAGGSATGGRSGGRGTGGGARWASRTRGQEQFFRPLLRHRNHIHLRKLVHPVRSDVRDHNRSSDPR